VAFDFLLDTIDKPLSNEIIKKIHSILKTGTFDAQKSWFAVGDWKRLANEVGGIQTVLPQNVEAEMNNLNEWYSGACHCGLDSQPQCREAQVRRSQSHEYSKAIFENIVEYHYRFEKIHPFQDGNGRVGRLILFRECLRNHSIPFIIDERHKQFYYRGLKEFDTVRGYLLDTCLSAQDTYREWVKYFYGDL
jgi:Fic family protein